MIKKADGKYRMCLNFRKVNSVTARFLFNTIFEQNTRHNTSILQKKKKSQ